jgi:hypothetical protein
MRKAEKEFWFFDVSGGFSAGAGNQMTNDEA